MPQRQGILRLRCFPHGERLQSEAGGNGIDEGQPGALRAAEIKSAIGARVRAANLKFQQQRGFAGGGSRSSGTAPAADANMRMRRSCAYTSLRSK